MDPRKCVVLVPVAHTIEPQCEEGLRALEALGYPVRRVRGYANIDQARNEMASRALHDGFDETMWIDSDIGFDPSDIAKLRSHSLPISCGIYAKKGKREFAIHVLPSAEHILFGVNGGLLEIRYAATGFLHVRREVYDTIRLQLQLPVCNTRFGERVVPYFLPMVIPDDRAVAANATSTDGDSWYLGEDYAFCERARQCQYRIMADSTIRLLHFGMHGFSWEEAGSSITRHANYGFRLT